MVEETNAASQTLTQESNQLKALLQNFTLSGSAQGHTARRAA